MYFWVKVSSCWEWDADMLFAPILGRDRRGRLLFAGARGQPFLEILRGIHDHVAAHDVVAGAAELGAADLVAPGLGGLEPEGHPHAGDHVLLDPELRHEEAVDDVLG